MLRTPFFEKHLSHNAKMVEFAGWEMPLQYKGIIHEHLHTRSHASLFDVSHMGRIEIEGEEAEKLLDFLSTNRITGKPDFSATYTCLCNEEGGTVDDTIIYKINHRSYFLIVNASRRDADLAHIQKYACGYKAVVTPRYTGEGILALQGPEAFTMFPQARQPKMQFKWDGGVFLASTGYTGAGGFEVYGPSDKLLELWDLFIERGAEPAGLGARDTLRLEKGYALYGHELSTALSPTESVSAWTVKNGRQFLGKEALRHDRHPYGVIMEGSGIPREGFKVFDKGENVGIVTSGGYSPSLKKPLALILTKKNYDYKDKIAIEIRGREEVGVITPLPFL